jgi:hypothetical protein
MKHNHTRHNWQLVAATLTSQLLDLQGGAS